ncbi:unnamed protein product, partial [Amoebophrya sp. A25]|eukprot:GSA25T00007795001.1
MPRGPGGDDAAADDYSTLLLNTGDEDGYGFARKDNTNAHYGTPNVLRDDAIGHESNTATAPVIEVHHVSYHKSTKFPEQDIQGHTQEQLNTAPRAKMLRQGTGFIRDPGPSATVPHVHAQGLSGLVASRLSVTTMTMRRSVFKNMKRSIHKLSRLGPAVSSGGFFATIGKKLSLVDGGADDDSDGVGIFSW